MHLLVRLYEHTGTKLGTQTHLLARLLVVDLLLHEHGVLQQILNVLEMPLALLHRLDSAAKYKSTQTY